MFHENLLTEFFSEFLQNEKLCRAARIFGNFLTNLTTMLQYHHKLKNNNFHQSSMS